jgi:EAL domain-containing protein (putative c-di-GMP-specific phosphodiesterase class I)
MSGAFLSGSQGDERLHNAATGVLRQVATPFRGCDVARQSLSVDDGTMSEIACESIAGLKPLRPGLSPEVLEWVSELRTVWAATGLSLNRFASLHPVDKGTLSRYLNGERVPRDRWFLGKLLAIQADNGKPVTPAVREHLTSAHLLALQTAHPHEYRVRMVSDELEIALTGKVEAERYARALEKQLAERNRQVQELTDDKGRLRTAWDADRAAMQAGYDRLTCEIDEMTGQLLGARKRAVQTELRCRQLEALLDHLDAHPPKYEDRINARFPMTGTISRRELQAALDEAVTHSAFTLAYQPVFSLTTGELAGFEALARWPHPRWGMMLPGQFIALAEETGQVVPLGSWVLGQAAADMFRWQHRLPGQAPLYVSVNVSARQFGDPGFVDSVRQALGTSGLEPSALMLELTESVPLRLAERISSDLMDLKAIGVRLAIEDFGTGYTSLSDLRELPVDVLKIDRSVIDGIVAYEQRLDHVQSILKIARSLQLDVIAEGIESEAQRNLLVSIGCQYGQGYLLGMPLGADKAEALTQIGHKPIPNLPR